MKEQNVQAHLIQLPCISSVMEEVSLETLNSEVLI